MRGVGLEVMVGVWTVSTLWASRTGPDPETGGSQAGSPRRTGHIFHYKRWNPTARALETVSNIAPLTTQEVIRLLEEAIVLSTEESALINYHPTKKLLPEMTGPTVTFSLVLGLRHPKAYRLWTVLETLSGNAALMLLHSYPNCPCGV